MNGNSEQASAGTGTSLGYCLLIILSASLINNFLSSMFGLAIQSAIVYGLVEICLFSELIKKYLPKASIPFREVLNESSSFLKWNLAILSDNGSTFDKLHKFFLSD